MGGAGGPFTLVDLAAVALAWVRDIVIALQVIGGSTGRMDINQTLLLNAFLLVEMLKVVLRLILQPRITGLRLLLISDTTAAYWYFWLARAISLVGYALMFVAPVVASIVSGPVAQAVRVFIMLVALVIAIVIVLQNRDRVRRALLMRHGVAGSLSAAAVPSLQISGTCWLRSASISR